MILCQYIGGKTENRIEKEIREIKERIHDLLENKNKNIIDSEVIKLGEELDEMLISNIKAIKKAC